MLNCSCSFWQYFGQIASVFFFETYMIMVDLTGGSATYQAWWWELIVATVVCAPILIIIISAEILIAKV